MLTLTNDFHNTEVRIRANVGDTLSRRRWRDVQRKLCGVTGCACGGVRGLQFDGDGMEFYIEENPDGGVTLMSSQR